MPLDIFRKSKPSADSLGDINVVADFREKSSLVPSELVARGIKVEFKQLAIGDYIAGKCVIERKSMHDLQSSVIDRRIFSQIDALRSQKDAFLIIEGKAEWKLHPNAFRGLVISVVKQGVPVIFSKDAADTADYIALMAKERKAGSRSMRPHRRLESRRDVAEYILEGIPGVGPVTAQRLLDKFGSIKNVIAATEEELKDALGSKYGSFKDAIG